MAFAVPLRNWSVVAKQRGRGLTALHEAVAVWSTAAAVKAAAASCNAVSQ